MAGSHLHALPERGQLLAPEPLRDALETQGDVYEAVEEFYGMVWFLAGGDPAKVEEAQRNYRPGLDLSPGVNALPGDEA